jgi:hypothetical protein
MPSLNFEFWEFIHTHTWHTNTHAHTRANLCPYVRTYASELITTTALHFRLDLNP